MCLLTAYIPNSNCSPSLKILKVSSTIFTIPLMLFSLGFTVTSHILDFITTLISLYFMNINLFHICFSLVSLDLLFLPVWECFHGTLYHESILTPALPLMHCIPIKALSMNRCCTQTSAILVVY